LEPEPINNNTQGFVVVYYWIPDGLVVMVRSSTSHPGVLGSFQNERNQGKQAHPVLKYREQ
jgi:hypothetical protein